MYNTHKDELYHYGIKGMKWGVRRYQNEDGSYTTAGKKRRGLSDNAKNALIIGGSVVAAGLIMYGGYKIGQILVDRESKRLRQIAKTYSDDVIFNSEKMRSIDEMFARARASAELPVSRKGYIKPETFKPDSFDFDTFEPETFKPDSFDFDTFEPKTININRIKPETININRIKPETINIKKGAVDEPLVRRLSVRYDGSTVSSDVPLSVAALMDNNPSAKAQYKEFLKNNPENWKVAKDYFSKLDLQNKYDKSILSRYNIDALKEFNLI